MALSIAKLVSKKCGEYAQVSRSSVFHILIFQMMGSILKAEETRVKVLILERHRCLRARDPAEQGFPVLCCVQVAKAHPE